MNIKDYRIAVDHARDSEGTISPAQAMKLALFCGIRAAVATRRAAVMEHGRKALQTRMRDALMAQDPNLKATPAEGQVRVNPEYIGWCDEAAEWAELGEKLAAYATYYNNLVRLLAREVAGV